MKWNTSWDNSAKKRGAIQSINPSVRFGMTGDSDVIEWADNNTEKIPTDAEIDAEIDRLDAEYDSQAYSRARANEYPDYRDYLDAIVKGDDMQKQKYIDDCKAVKLKYPKG
jgi:hypothetical protein